MDFSTAFLGGVHAAVTVFGFLFVVGLVLMAISFIAFLVTAIFGGDETKGDGDDGEGA